MLWQLTLVWLDWRIIDQRNVPQKFMAHEEIHTAKRKSLLQVCNEYRGQEIVMCTI